MILILSPVAASFTSLLCHFTASFISSAFSSVEAFDDGSNAAAHLSVATDAGRMVSVRPCLKAAVLQDSYATGLCLYCR